MKKSRAKGAGEEYALVYSTDKAVNVSQQKVAPVENESARNMPSSIGKPRSRIERKGRGGKTVTVISGILPHPHMIEDLCASLKKWLGCGGSHRLEAGEGFIELQGDRREQLEALFARFNIERLRSKR